MRSRLVQCSSEMLRRVPRNVSKAGARLASRWHSQKPMLVHSIVPIHLVESLFTFFRPDQSPCLRNIKINIIYSCTFRRAGYVLSFDFPYFKINSMEDTLINEHLRETWITFPAPILSSYTQNLCKSQHLISLLNDLLGISPLFPIHLSQFRQTH